MSNKKRDLRNESFLDFELKMFYIKHGVEIFGFEVRLNYEEPFGADLVAVHDSSIKIELERSSAVHEYWEDDYFGDRLDYGFPTVNMEWDRKGHFFQEYHMLISRISRKCHKSNCS